MPRVGVHLWHWKRTLVQHQAHQLRVLLKVLRKRKQRREHLVFVILLPKNLQELDAYIVSLANRKLSITRPGEIDDRNVELVPFVKRGLRVCEGPRRNNFEPLFEMLTKSLEPRHVLRERQFWILVSSPELVADLFKYCSLHVRVPLRLVVGQLIIGEQNANSSHWTASPKCTFA